MAVVSAYKKQKSERFLIYLLLLLMSALYLLFVGACEKQASSTLKEQDEPFYRIGQAEARKGDYNGALKAYLRLIDIRKDCPQSHLEAGRIYLFSLKDYVFAIYHFRKFIEMQSVIDPSSPLIANVKQMIETAKKTMIISLPQSPYEDSEPLESAIAKLKQENYELKQSIITYSSTIKRLEEKNASIIPTMTQARATTTSTQATNSNQATTSTQPRIARSVSELRSPTVQRDIPDTYTVKAGDTLSTISNKIYGTQARWNEIFRYNSSTLSSPEKLKVGQVLRLPR